jgi:Leucine-rich repeat (LRR) protein
MKERIIIGWRKKLLINQFRHFDIHSNKISRIPLGIRTMSDLEYLDISNNSLSELPLCVVAFGKLSFLKYDGNKRIERMNFSLYNLTFFYFPFLFLFLFP